MPAHRLEPGWVGWILFQILRRSRLIWTSMVRSPTLASPPTSSWRGIVSPARIAKIARSFLLAIGQFQRLATAFSVRARAIWKEYGPQIPPARAWAAAAGRHGARMLFDAQDQFARIERLGQVIVRARSSPSMRLSVSVRAVSMRIGTSPLRAQRLGQFHNPSRPASSRRAR